MKQKKETSSNETEIKEKISNNLSTTAAELPTSKPNNSHLAIAPAFEIGDRQQQQQEQQQHDQQQEGEEQKEQKEEDDDDDEEQQQQEQQQGAQLFTVDNAFRVLTPEEQRQQRLERERQNLPLIEGKVVNSPSDHENKKKEQQNRSRRRFITWLGILLLLIVIVIIVVVPSLLLTRQNRRQTNPITTSLLSSSPSVSLVPSISPSESIVPSSFPTTSSPTSITFQNVVQILGLNEERLSLDPNNYVFRSILWMVEQDQITRAVVFRQQTTTQQDDVVGASLLQRFAIISLYFATNGDMWFDRLAFLNPFTHECTWQVFGRRQVLFGATINCDVDNVITGIALNDNNLGGMILSEIGLLTQLTWLELDRNFIGGTLPSSLSQLSQLLESNASSFLCHCDCFCRDPSINV